MNDEIMELLMAVLYTVRYRHFQAKRKGLSGEELADAMRERIRAKDADLKGDMTSQGTTPRRLTDLLGSLCDLTSGSGDRGTPVILIQNYFTNYATE